MKTVSVTPEKSVVFAPRFPNEGGRVGDFFKELYHNSNSITDAVMKCYESGLGLIWDSYNSFTKALTDKDEKYLIQLDKYMHDSNNYKHWDLLNTNHVSDPLGTKSKIPDFTPSEKRFSDFVCNLYFANTNVSPFQIIDYVNYVNTVASLRTTFADTCSISIWGGDDNTIKFDIENSIEYFKGNLFIGDRNAVIFKIRPYINLYGRQDVLEGMNESHLNNYEFYINIDYDSVVASMITKIKLPDQYDLLNKGEDAALTKETYIADNLGKFAKEIEIVGENIILELSLMASKLMICGVTDFYKHLHNNMQKYVNYEDSNILRFINLTNNVFHRDLRGISPVNWKLINGRMNMNAIESINKVLDDGPDMPYIGKEPFVSEIGEAIDYAGRNGKNVFDIIELYIFRKAFTHYYENAISVNFTYKYETITGEDATIKAVTYSREFNEVRDFNTLSSVAAGIQNYVIKDYFVNLVNKYSRVKLHEYVGKKLPNGESTFYMYSKIKRLRWFTMFSATNILASINPRISQVTSMYSGVEDSKVQAILADAVSSYRQFFNMWMTALGPLANDIGVPLPDHYYSTYHCDCLEKDYKMFVYQLNYNNSFTGDHNFYQNISEIAKLFNSKIDDDSKYRSSIPKRIVSYNSENIEGGASLDTDVLFKKIINRLKDFMMLNIDRYFS